MLQQLDGSLSGHDDDGKIAMKKRNLRPETLGAKHVITLGKEKTWNFRVIFSAWVVIAEEI